MSYIFPLTPEWRWQQKEREAVLAIRVEQALQGPMQAWRERSGWTERATLASDRFNAVAHLALEHPKRRQALSDVDELIRESTETEAKLRAELKSRLDAELVQETARVVDLVMEAGAPDPRPRRAKPRPPKPLWATTRSQCKVGCFPMDITLRYGHPLIVEDDSWNDTRPHAVRAQFWALWKAAREYIWDAERALSINWDTNSPSTKRADALVAARRLAWVNRHWATMLRDVRRASFFKPHDWREIVEAMKNLEARLRRVRALMLPLLMNGDSPSRARPRRAQRQGGQLSLLAGGGAS